MSDNILVKKILEYIEMNLDGDLSLDKISKDLCYSKFYIERVFLEKTNCTIYKYIQGRRLTLAASKLVETDKAIIEIAYEAGYSSQQAFNYAFRKLYFCTPQTYRKNGVFYPIQEKINMKSALFCLSYSNFILGGKIAA